MQRKIAKYDAVLFTFRKHLICFSCLGTLTPRLLCDLVQVRCLAHPQLSLTDNVLSWKKKDSSSNLCANNYKCSA